MFLEEFDLVVLFFVFDLVLDFDDELLLFFFVVLSFFVVDLVELDFFDPENRIAREATTTFLLNLAESVAIVIAVIMLVMGLPF